MRGISSLYRPSAPIPSIATGGALRGLQPSVDRPTADLTLKLKVRGPPGRLRWRRWATLPLVAAPERDESFVEKLSRQGEEALGKIAEELIANPVVNGAITRAFEAREKAVQAQEAAMGALNLPSAADIERVTRRLRSLSQRLEGIEDAIDRLEERLAALGRQEPLGALEERLEEIARDIAALRESVVPSGNPVPRAQERLTVTD
jgi:hypothetical protein